MTLKSRKYKLVYSVEFKKNFQKLIKLDYGCLIFVKMREKNLIIWKEFKTGNQKLIALNDIILNKDL